jgi:hypothetical protein
LNFSTGIPVANLNSAMTVQNEGCVTQSTPTGSLLFYSNAVDVYNQLHQPITGTPLNGNQSNSQSSISIPVPGSPNRYYLFTLGPWDSGSAKLWYTIVDITTPPGVLININTPVPIPGGNTLSEQITAIPKCNGTDYWLIVHQGGGNGQNFYAYSVTSSGMTPPVSVRSSAS